MNEQLIEEATAIDADGYRQLVSENMMLRTALEDIKCHVEFCRPETAKGTVEWHIADRALSGKGRSK